MNRGREGDEILDGSYNLNNARRRSNSFADHPTGFKTKFETVETEPVFEEDIHGPLVEEHEGEEALGQELDKASTSGSVESQTSE